MHCPQCIMMYVCMKQIEREGKSPQGGGSGGGLIGPLNAAQSNLHGVRRNRPETFIRGRLIPSQPLFLPVRHLIQH